MNNQHLRLTADLETYTIDLRRHFHQNPELSLHETETCKRITQELDQMGISYELVPPCSVVAKLKGKPSTKSIAIRGDIDALPMKEDSSYLFRSAVENVAHTCGHDAHTAILLGTAKYFAKNRDLVVGTIYFCFQCGEEISEGASEIIDYLNKNGGVCQAIGLHVVPELCAGQISVEAGPRMAGNGLFDVTVTGRGGHGSRPDRCLDPIRPACEMILKMSAFPSNHHNALEPTVVNIGSLHAGTAANIVPDTSEFTGTIRMFTQGLSSKMITVLTAMVKGTALAYGVDANAHFYRTIEPVINSPDASALAYKIVDEIEGLVATEVEPDMGSDNFGEFISAYGGLYAFLGIAETLDTAFPHHHCKFHIDESALKYGVEFFVRYVNKYLQA